MKLTKAQRRDRRRRLRAYRRLKTRLNFVDHPRYGDQPIRSGAGFSEEEIRDAYWGYSLYREKIIFPETAIRADVSKQNYGCFPRRLYVDIARQCRKCHRWFLFFALEQRHWYETLGFNIDADCVHCQECRHETHALKAGVERYEVLLGQSEKTVEDWDELAEIADNLWDDGYIRRPETLQKSRMPKRLRGAR